MSSTYIQDYWRRAWGLEDRPKFKYGGSWADWMANFSDQMTFEEYLRMDIKEKKPHILDRKADGGRIGFYKGSFVEGNPVGQQWVVKFASKSTSPGYPDNFIGTQKFATEELMNQAIEDRKLISKKNIEIRDKKNVEMGKAKKSEYTKIIDDFIEKGDYENFKAQVSEKQMKKKIGSGNLRQTSGGRVSTHIVKFIRDRLDAGPGTELFEELKEITGKSETELLEFNKNLAPRGDIPTKKRSKTAEESWPDELKLTDEEKKEGQRKHSETRKTKEKVGTKYASELELKNAAKIKKQISDLNTMFKNNPDLINTPQFAKLKEMMEIQIAGTDRTLPSGKEVKAGELFRREVDSKGNLLTDEYYKNKAKQGKIMSFFDINKVGTQMGKYATNINIAPGLFNSAFIEGQVETYFKKGGKFHGDTEKLKKVDDYLKSVGVKVKITDVGRIGGGNTVFFDSKTGKFPHISDTLKIMGFSDDMVTQINPPTKFQKFLQSTPVKLIKGISKAGARTVGAAMPVIGPGMVAWGLSDVNKAHAAGLTNADELAVAYNFGPEIAKMWSEYKAKEMKPTLAGKEGLPEIDAFAAKDGGLSGVDQYILNRYK